MAYHCVDTQVLILPRLLTLQYWRHDTGIVTTIGFEPTGYGNWIRINHDWGESIYSQLNTIAVTEGQKVAQGEPIGKSGNSGASTGSHLSFDIRISPYQRGDGWGGFSDPLPYLQEALNGQ